MSSSVNKVILVGRLGKDPEVRYTQGGTAVANFSLATDESYKKDGEVVKKVEWHNVVVWGPAVENFVEKYIHKGDLVYVEGKLQTRQWKDKSENTRYTTEINVSDIKALQTSNGGSNNSGSTKSSSARPAQAQSQEISDEDIPF